MGNRRGRLIVGDERRQIIASVKEALGSGSRLGPACEQMEISARTYQRWRRPDTLRAGFSEFGRARIAVTGSALGYFGENCR